VFWFDLELCTKKKETYVLTGYRRICFIIYICISSPYSHYLFFLGSTRVLIRALHLLGRHCTARTMLLSYNNYFCLKIHKGKLIKHAERCIMSVEEIWTNENASRSVHVCEGQYEEVARE
jgi:hypothetical protein